MSHSEVEISGDLPKIIGNEENLYEGNLIYYFQVLFFKANNLYNPYHNFRHMSHALLQGLPVLFARAAAAANAHAADCCIIPRL